jgi:signal peptidase I
MNEYIETIPTGKKGKDAEKSFHIGQDSQYPPIFLSQVMHFPNDDACVYFGSGENTGFSCKVPKGYYWMMGDNRDRSEDSRYWGFVPESYLRGRAFFIWFNWEDLKTFAFKRIGSLID